MSEQFASDTSGRSIGEWIKALVVLFVGLTIAHLGVTLFLLSETGTDTFTVFIQGLASTAGLSVGTMHVIVSVILMAVMVFTTKGYVKPGTIVCAFCGGPIIDVFKWMFQPYINGDSAMPVRIVSMLAGCVILALGMSIVINSNAGTGPNDLVAIILTDKIKKIEFRWVRMGCDVLFVVLGFLLGGSLWSRNDRGSVSDRTGCAVLAAEDEKNSKKNFERVAIHIKRKNERQDRFCGSAFFQIALFEQSYLLSSGFKRFSQLFKVIVRVDALWRRAAVVG